ncbi:hypothetical protein JOF56_010027 [Kibdelosporangium banguiense]|uniref:Uncharacterized protein n=1 Tax=Kibdelosporangium banguiense TaxID=1365924 RepID=A0ABS4TYZ9_9PSEU|nr:hypothetical protein [Kibdelosporangium banguiense]
MTTAVGITPQHYSRIRGLLTVSPLLIVRTCTKPVTTLGESVFLCPMVEVFTPIPLIMMAATTAR